MDVQQELDRIAVEAYEYLYPLVSMEITRRVITSAPPGTGLGAGPVNQMHHARAFPPGDFRDVVRPNFDTLYSIAWIDLSDGPVIVSLAREVDRYFMLPLLDMWTDVFASIGTRTTGGGAASYLVVGPGWAGEAPDGMTVLESPTPVAWLIGRVQTNGTDDYPAVHEIQDALTVSPLRPGSASGSAADDVDLRTPPPAQVHAMTGEEFFALGAELLRVHPPHAVDQPMLARMARLGLHAGESLDVARLTAEATGAIERAPASALEQMQAAMRLAPVENGWSFSRQGMGVYGADYLFRASIAMAGLGANLAADAVYPMIRTDAAGEVPVGEHDYVLRFSADDLPPAGAFWSLTMYDGEGYTVPNAIDRYALGDRDPLRFGHDGSLEIIVSREDPGGEWTSNWLPSPEGPLGLTMRIYDPQEPALDGGWSPPPLHRLGG